MGITPRSTRTRISCIRENPSISQLDVSKNYAYLIEPWEELRNEECSYERVINMIP